MSPARILAGTVLAAWAGLFWFLLLSDRTPLYLSSRTAWVVPVGGAILTLAALGRLATARTRAPEPLGVKRALGFAAVILPVVVILFSVSLK